MYASACSLLFVVLLIGSGQCLCFCFDGSTSLGSMAPKGRRTGSPKAKQLPVSGYMEQLLARRHAATASGSHEVAGTTNQGPGITVTNSGDTRGAKRAAGMACASDPTALAEARLKLEHDKFASTAHAAKGDVAGDLDKFSRRCISGCPSFPTHGGENKCGVIVLQGG